MHLTDMRKNPLDFGIFQTNKRFCRENALVMSTMCSLSYHSPKDQREWATQQPSVRQLHLLDSSDNVVLGCQAEDTGTQLTVVETEKALLVAARGTPLTLSREPGVALQWEDLKNDLNALPVENYDGSARVHGGFKRAADGIWEQLKPLLSQAMAANKVIHFTGHSLGAVIATHLADRMHQEFKSVPESLTTLGSPDPGWSGEKQHLREIGLDQRTLRFVNNIDPVPGVIPFGDSIGKTVYLDSRGRAQVGEGSHFGDRWRGVGKALLHARFNPLQGHFPSEYRAAIALPENAEILNSL